MKVDVSALLNNINIFVKNIKISKLPFISILDINLIFFLQYAILNFNKTKF